MASDSEDDSLIGSENEGDGIHWPADTEINRKDILKRGKDPSKTRTYAGGLRITQLNEDSVYNNIES